MNGVGVLAGLATAMLWTATAVCFEVSSKRLGSFTVNVLRLAIAAALFIALSLVRVGEALPSGLTYHMWRDLILSGLIGFVVGDAMLFRAFVLVGARLSMLIYASVPAMTAIGGYVFLGETIAWRGLLGMAITAIGIGVSVSSNERHAASGEIRRTRLGIVLALGGAAGQAGGLLLGKRGSVGLDSFSATEIRVFAGTAGFLLLAFATRRLSPIVATIRSIVSTRHERSSMDGSEMLSTRKAFAVLVLGALLGPFLGVSLGLLSTQLLPAGVASTLMSIVPALMVPVSAVVLREVVTAGEIVGTLTAIVGVAVLVA